MPKKRSTYRVLTSDTSPTAITSGMIVPKSPKEPASSDRENLIGVEDIGGMDFGYERSGDYPIRYILWSMILFVPKRIQKSFTNH
jgi:hypothetical protein